MNKKHFILLIILLSILLHSGCSSSRVKKGVANLQNETSAIRQELADLESRLSDKLRTLDTHIEEEASATRKDISGLESSVDERIRKTDSSIEEETAAIAKEVTDLKSSLDAQAELLSAGIEANGSQFRNETSATRKQLDNLDSSLSKKVQELNAAVQANGSQLGKKLSDFDEATTTLNTDFQAILGTQKLYLITAFGILCLVIACGFMLLRHRIISSGNTLQSELASSLEGLKNELMQLDTRLTPGVDHGGDADNALADSNVEPDHTLPIKVCEEIQRMRNRLKHMDENDQATKVFTKRLESLEDMLNGMGYEIVNLENEPYKEGMTLKASFISNEEMKKDEEIITRVFKPQVNYNNILIQAAEVEVSMGM